MVFDINGTRICELKKGEDRTLEVNKQELEEAMELAYTNDPNQLQEANIFIVTVPTPIDNYKTPDLTPLEKASSMVGKVLKKGDIVIYESTVFPGCTEGKCACPFWKK